MKIENKLRQLADKSAPDNFAQTAEKSGLGESNVHRTGMRLSKIGMISAAVAVCLLIGVGTLIGPDLKNIAASGNAGEGEIQNIESIATTGNGYLDTAIRGHFALRSDAPITAEMLAEITSIRIFRDNCNDIYIAGNDAFAASGDTIITYIVNGTPVKMLSPIFSSEVYEEIYANLGKGKESLKLAAYYLHCDENKIAQFNDAERREEILRSNPHVYDYMKYIPENTEFYVIDPVIGNREIMYLMTIMEIYSERSQYFRISSDLTAIPDVGFENLPNLTEFSFTPDTVSDSDIGFGISSLTAEQKEAFKYTEYFGQQEINESFGNIEEQTQKAIEAVDKYISEAVADGTLDPNYALDIDGDGEFDHYYYDEYLEAMADEYLEAMAE